MLILVTGAAGQVATALAESQTAGVSVIAAGRPGLDLLRPDSVRDTIAAVRPDVVVNAAAWTAVDRAESEPEAAFAVNEAGAAAVAEAACAIGAAVIQLSTDYVFDGTLARPWRETDAPNPASVYGASKLSGERAVAGAAADHAILRTSWVHAAHGANFLRTMLRLAETRDEVGVVADQFGAPTYAPDLAAAIITVASNLLAEPSNARMRGLFHAAGGGETASWADFAEAIFAGLAARGGKTVRVRRIATADYPTPARRPADARLDCGKLAAIHGVTMPDWRTGVELSLDRLIGPRRAG
jgi:dTDP-4-dehydrorhamnose reductase